MSQYQQQPAWPPAPKPDHTRRNVILALVGIAVIVALGVIGKQSNQASQKPSTHTVVYKIAGTTKAASLITYTTGSAGTTEQFSDAAVPWTKTFEISRRALSYQVIVQNDSRQYGTTVTCAIVVDGAVVNTATGDGASTIAHCVYRP
jgi:hypothetical protein